MTHNYKASYIGNFKGKAPVELLRQCFTPNFSRGVLYWAKNRPANHFKTSSGHKQYVSMFEGQEVGIGGLSDIKYKTTYLFDKNYVVGHIIWALKYGYWPSRLHYKDGSRSNTSIYNLTDKSDDKYVGPIIPKITPAMRIVNKAFSGRSAAV